MGFKINALEITCPMDKLKDYNHIYKNLKSKFYLFNDFYKLIGDNGLGDPKTKILLNPIHNEIDTFFDENGQINIQAIIGKNGSGKSSVMDLMYMAINNYAFLYINGFDNPNHSEHLFFIPGVFVSLYFSDKEKIYILKCFDNVIELKQNEEVKYQLRLGVSSNYSDSQRINIAEDFFYSIVSNYSLQSFIPDNYKGIVKQSINGKLEDVDDSWINQVFNKNDRYVRPLVLNPYRGDGIIDLSREMALSKDRLISSLIYSKNKDEIKVIPFEYELDHIDYYFNSSFLLNKVNEYFEKYFIEDEYSLSIEEKDNYTFEELKDNDELFQSIEAFFGENTSIIVSINKYFHVQLQEIDKLSEVQKNAIAYLLYKMFWISRKYNDYKQYYNAFVYKSGKLQMSNEALFLELANRIKRNDGSHVVKKAHRIYRFLEISNQIAESFEYLKDYLWRLQRQSPVESPKSIDWTLPPSIFSYELILKKSDGSLVNYKSLSSGQIQLLQTISVHLYHIGNVISNLNNTETSELSIKYNKINLVFDEVEICFHPEFQRIFIKYLISMIKNLHVLNDCSINIFILSHSPFILSDIPKGRVLYLEEGKMDTEKAKMSTFAGNIGKMVYDSFYLQSSIGAFAEDKLKELIEHKMNSIGNNEKDDVYFKNISDPVTKSLINEIEADNDKN